MALAGGRGGLDKMREMLGQIRGKGDVHLDSWPAYVLLEIGQGQAEMVTALVSEYFPLASIELIPDLGGIERVAKVGL